MTEFSVAIVDDDCEFAALLMRQIQEWGNSNECSINIDYMNSASMFLNRINELEKWSALFFDVQIPKFSGIDLAREIRQINTEIPIAFISAYPLFSIDGYEVTACRFIVKNRPEFKEKLHECMQYILSQILEVGPTVFYIQSQNHATSVLFKDILYFEAQLHNIVVWTTTDKIQYRQNISELILKLPKYFVQTSRSYIVNMKRVKAIHSNRVELEDGHTVQLTKTYKKEVMDRFMRK